MKTPISSWGKLSAPLHEVISLRDRVSAAASIARATPGLPFGNGRSYGDAGLNPGGYLWLTRQLDHFIQFDPSSGRLRCEAGVLLQDIQRLLIPRGWILPVTPGTQLITVGGAIANDVHGKNHHVLGSFGDHVLSLELLRSDGQTLRCGPDQNPDWFAATVGGVGLTGLITEAVLQLRPTPGPWLDSESLPYTSLDAFFELADSSEAAWEHTVSWLDCLSPQGRGIFLRANPAPAGNAATPSRPARSVPFTPPMSLVNTLTLRPFNWLYYQMKRRHAGRGLAHYESFFYPLDALLDWNRIYGPRGFYQYQSVVPRAAGHEAVGAMLRAIARAGEGSFLAVLKTFGARQPIGMLSFPRPGVTLALDFPNRGERSLRLMTELDAIVREAGGRLYLAKDARMPRDLFEQSYPRHREFSAYRDPGIRSGLSRRLFGN